MTSPLAAAAARALPVDGALRRPLSAFLSGTSLRLLDQLAAAGQRRSAYLQPGLGHDRDAAVSFFALGPQALRRLRLRHGRPPGSLSRADIETMLAAEVRDAIGDFRLPTPAGTADAFLARKARRWARG